MGNTILAKCRICDFEKKFNYGGSRSNYKTSCPVPAINTQTGHFENVNYISEKNNSIYKFYSDKELKGDNGDNYTLNNFDLKLNEINNYCPKCKSNSLDFRITHFFS